MVKQEVYVLTDVIMSKIYQINTMQQASDWLSKRDGHDWLPIDVIEYALNSGWNSGNSDGINILSSVPGWVGHGVGELPRLTPDGEVCYSVVTDGLITVNDAVLQSILNHGRASLSSCTHISGAPFVTIEDLRIMRDELNRIKNVVRQESVTSTNKGVEVLPKVQTAIVAINPWEIADPRDPAPEQPWFTPARYFARQLVRVNSTLLTKRNLLAEKTSQSLANVAIYKRGGKKKLSSSTILKAFNNIDFN